MPYQAHNKIRDPGFQFAAILVMSLVTLSIVLPFLLLFLSSITSEQALLTNGYSFFPKEFSMDAYGYIFNSKDKILRAYGMTILITVTGTAISIFLTVLFAYPLSVKKLPGKRIITFLVFFTMLFNGGLVPTYILWSNYLHIKDTVWGLILPGMLLGAWNILLMRTYFASNIPDSLFEAAEIDGAGQGRILFSIVFPLGKPIIVTIATFTALAYWNDWTNGLYYITKRTELYTIQNLLNRMVSDLQYLIRNVNLSASMAGELARIPTTGVQMAIAFVAIIPILILFPFLQRYYSKGITLGAVKG
ncbi:MAG: carbohydrate ABC transporter permease [Treponema sp.]|nr:carbohydrate ABC transporter permease [Treponema sp.]